MMKEQPCKKEAEGDRELKTLVITCTYMMNLYIEEDAVPFHTHCLTVKRV